MAMLDRYKKPGGFLQLLNLIETSGPQKQEKFLKLIREEDPRWADALEQKTLSMAKIMGWDPQALMEITAFIQEIVLVTALHGMQPEMQEKLLSSMSNSQRRNVTEAFKATSPSAAEVSSVFARMITDVRRMITEGRLRMDKVDPAMVVDEGIEDNLKKAPLTEQPKANVSPLNEAMAAFATPPPQAKGSSPASINDANAATLKAKVQQLLSENAKLREEVAVLKGKLDHIKKIA